MFFTISSVIFFASENKTLPKLLLQGGWLAKFLVSEIPLNFKIKILRKICVPALHVKDKFIKGGSI